MDTPGQAVKRYHLDELPSGLKLQSVTATPVEFAGRRAVRVELTDEVTLHGVAGVDYVDMPTFAVIPADFTDGTIEVDILSRLNGKGPDDARAFAGIAYRIGNDKESFEAVYLRPLNGRRAGPGSPRDRRAVQYFAFPDWKYDRLREQYPNGDFEAGADIGPDEWIRLRLDLDGRRVKVYVDDIEVLGIDQAKGSPISGSLGLFVDIGTEAYFSDLRISPR